MTFDIHVKLLFYLLLINKCLNRTDNTELVACPLILGLWYDVKTDLLKEMKIKVFLAY